MPLTLLAGPANAGKVALLLDRYAADIAREPVLVVPNRAEVQRVQRDLVAGGKAVVGGSVGTFDDLFAGIARGNGDHRAVLSDTQRGLLLRRLARDTSPFAGYAETLGATLAELESGSSSPRISSRSRRSCSARIATSSTGSSGGTATASVATQRTAWPAISTRGTAVPSTPTGSRISPRRSGRSSRGWGARADVTVSLPYEPGRLAFTALERTAATLSKQAAGRIEELPPRPSAT